MPTIDISGVPHAYDLTASIAAQPTLVFVHGWLLSRHYWQPTINKLMPDYQCLSYDLRGFGHSQAATYPIAPSTTNGNSRYSNTVEFTDKSDSRYTPAAYARDIEVLLNNLEIDRVWLVGHSLGGTIALWAAHLLPDKVQGVVCLNSGGGIYLKEDFEKFRAAGQQILKYRPQWLRYLPILDLMFCKANVARPIARNWGRQRVIDFVTAQREAAVGALLDSTTEAEVNRLPKLVSALEQPVYFLAGDRDDIMEPQYVHHLASFHFLYQDCGQNAIQIPNCGHMSMVEQPNVVARQIRQIIGSHQLS